MQIRNPYSPPQAIVVDAPEIVRMRPDAIRRAFVLMGCNFAVSFAAVVIDWRHTVETVSPIVFGAYEFVVVSVLVWLYVKIWTGRNWARITYLVIECLFMPLGALTLPETAARAPVVAGLHLIIMGLDLGVFYLLFFPGRDFFKPPRPVQPA